MTVHHENDHNDNNTNTMVQTLTTDLGKSQSSGIRFALELLELSNKNTKLHCDINALRQTNTTLEHQLQELLLPGRGTTT
eukprot:CAMPEP_0170820764 /NCGR_PEP_ID=MMETSP0733-20121128/42576_1 /TAXON_ID=186038 /ORGANISM="Fragilariopsis kerguelensis, Strain L26-C5" /LENGTH=79 /DNA_ID=CAMNT_0011182231 /DNA_START=19 /DNA_END=254 /DNA_ORIENTATION=+